ncbi:DNA polymerase epsilon subunit 4-like [Patiria miniata]|uniref:Transcription factor CBF/NF-Y/archaeal histone domain-containing protein n=1 Tax=Patiria miniata TaxID=46514 RepID=A0A913ZY79_PATMI|nr:DNA polymerase epsilon subunit 4-like [Patiria miniata]
MEPDVTGSQQNGEGDSEAKAGTEDMMNASMSTKSNRITRLPLTRIKNIMKTDPDVTLASQESVLLIAKATEMFLQHFAKMSYGHTARSKRKTIKRQDIDLSVEALDAYAFLEGMLE